MDGASSMHGMKNAYKIVIGKPKGRDHLERCESMNGRMDLIEIGCARMDWIHLPQDRVQWHGLVNMEMNLSSIKGRGFLLYELLLASQGFCSKGLVS
jgi:hypothetical protein